MEEWQASASEPVPSRTPREELTCHPLPGQPDPRLCPEFLPIQNTVCWETQAAAAWSSRHPRGRREPKSQKDPVPAQEPSFISNLLAHIPCSPEAFSFSANPVLDCLPLLPPMASPCFFPVIWSELYVAVGAHPEKILWGLMVIFF